MLGILKVLLIAIIGATIAQVPLGYITLSRESLFLGEWFVNFDSQLTAYFLSVVVVSLTTIVVLGLPAYFALKFKKWNNTINILVIGVLIPSAIIIGLELVSGNGSSFSAGENFYGHYRAIIDAGQRTYWGWIKLAEQLVVFGLHGCVGAFVFHKLYLRGSNA